LNTGSDDRIDSTERLRQLLHYQKCDNSNTVIVQLQKCSVLLKAETVFSPKLSIAGLNILTLMAHFFYMLLFLQLPISIFLRCK